MPTSSIHEVCHRKPPPWAWDAAPSPQSRLAATLRHSPGETRRGARLYALPSNGQGPSPPGASLRPASRTFRPARQGRLRPARLTGAGDVDDRVSALPSPTPHAFVGADSRSVSANCSKDFSLAFVNNGPRCRLAVLATGICPRTDFPSASPGAGRINRPLKACRWANPLWSPHRGLFPSLLWTGAMRPDPAQQDLVERGPFRRPGPKQELKKSGSSYNPGSQKFPQNSPKWGLDRPAQ